MTHQVVAFARPMQLASRTPSAMLPLPVAQIYPAPQGTTVALSVALRYLAARRSLRRARIVVPRGEHG